MPTHFIRSTTSIRFHRAQVRQFTNLCHYISTLIKKIYKIGFRKFVKWKIRSPQTKGRSCHFSLQNRLFLNLLVFVFKIDIRIFPNRITLAYNYNKLKIDTFSYIDFGKNVFFIKSLQLTSTKIQIGTRLNTDFS